MESSRRPLRIPAALAIAANVTNCAMDAVDLAVVLATPAGGEATEAELQYEQEEVDTGIVLLCILLLMALVAGHLLEMAQIRRLHAAGVVCSHLATEMLATHCRFLLSGTLGGTSSWVVLRIHCWWRTGQSWYTRAYGSF
eukprot:SAG31_NODE_600_length_13647_cov_3.894376_4_plen_140_part_00